MPEKTQATSSIVNIGNRPATSARAYWPSSAGSVVVRKVMACSANGLAVVTTCGSQHRWVHCHQESQPMASASSHCTNRTAPAAPCPPATRGRDATGCSAMWRNGGRAHAVLATVLKRSPTPWSPPAPEAPLHPTKLHHCQALTHVECMVRTCSVVSTSGKDQRILNQLVNNMVRTCSVVSTSGLAAEVSTPLALSTFSASFRPVCATNEAEWKTML